MKNKDLKRRIIDLFTYMVQTSIKNKELKRRIISLSYKHKLSHLGSCLTAVDIIDEIFKIKKPDEKFILSSGHAGLALYVALEKYGGRNAEEIYKHHGTHPDRCNDCGISCSTGSLGHGLPISVGMALADRLKDVYCLISDGECAEGSIWEALRLTHEQKLNNLKVYINHNGWAAYKKVTMHYLPKPLVEIVTIRNTIFEFPFLIGNEAHYKVMNESNYQQAMRLLR